MKKNCLWNIALCLTAMASLATLAACNDDEAPSDGKTTETGSYNPVTVTAQIAGPPTTRLVLGDDTGVAGTETAVYWSPGTTDNFSLHYSKANEFDRYIFTKESTADKVKSASFTCDNAPTLSAPTTLYAIYPGFTDVLPTAFNFSFSLAQQGGTQTDVASKCLMAAKATNVSDLSTAKFNFEYKVAILKLTLKHSDFKGQNVSGITFTATGLKNYAYYNMESGEWSIQGGSSSSITVSKSMTGDASSGAITIYLAAFPDQLTNCKISAACGNNNYSVDLSDIKLEAGNLYRASVLMDKKVLTVATGNSSLYKYQTMNIGTWEEDGTTQKLIESAIIESGSGEAKFYYSDATSGLQAGMKIWVCIPKVVKYFHTLTADELKNLKLVLPDKDKGSTLKATPTAGGKAYENDWIVALYMGINKDGATGDNAVPIYWATGNLMATKTNDANSGATKAAFHISTVAEAAGEGGNIFLGQNPYRIPEGISVSSSDGFAGCAIGVQWNLFTWGKPTGLVTSTQNSDYNSFATAKDESICGTEHDICRVQLGGNWRLPSGGETSGELYVLKDKITSQYNDNGLGLKYDYTFTTDFRQSITNTLAFPSAGYRYGSDGNTEEEDPGISATVGNYWSGTAYSSTHAYSMYFYAVPRWQTQERKYALAVRPVTE